MNTSDNNMFFLFSVNVSKINNSTNVSSLEHYRAFIIGNWLWKFGSPTLILVGTFGNLVSICVLRRPNLRQSTTMFYLTCLNIGDLCCLYTGLLRYWISRAFDIDIRMVSSFSRKLHTFLVYQFLDFTVWSLVSVTIDRCISVSFPFRSKYLCTIRRCKLVVVVLFLVLSAKNLHFFWTIDVVNSWEFRCDGNSDGNLKFLRYIWPWVDSSVFCLVPFTIMIMCNIKIVHAMFSSRDNMRNYGNLKTNTHRRCAGPLPAVISNEITEMSVNMAPLDDNHDNTSVQQQSNESLPNKSTPQNKLPSLTAMLMTVNCVFLVTTSPIQIFLIGEEYWFSERTEEQIAWYNFWWAVVNILQYLNNAVHIFLYCLTGPKFRRELQLMFRKRNIIDLQVENKFKGDNSCTEQ